MASNIFDRDYWLDWKNWDCSKQEAQKVSDMSHEDTLPWRGIWDANIEFNMRVNIESENDWITSEYGKHEGPVLVCGAGPSLSTNIETVKRIYDAGIPIFAVDRSFGTLKENGIRPTLAFSADAQSCTVDFYKGYHDEGDRYAFHITCNPNITSIIGDNRPLWYGSINPFCGYWTMVLKKWGKQLACLRAGVVVTFFAVDAALWMGYDPIVTIGNELSWKSRQEADDYIIGYPQLVRKHEESGLWIIKAFGDAAGCFSMFPFFHPDISFIDLSDGLCKYFNWQVGEFNNLEKECA